MKRPYILLWLLLSVALVIIVTIAFLDSAEFGGIELKQAPYRDVLLAEEQPAEPGEYHIASTDSTDWAVVGEGVTAEPDTTVKTVLIFGDSMTILVANRMAAYGKQNGYSVSSVTWDSSSSVGWSGCDTLDNYIARVHPDFIMVTLGSNELFLQNFDRRRPYVEKLVEKFGDIPFVWIGPPNWKTDKGFNDMMEKTLPTGTYFRTEGMDLPRGKDNVHPTPRGGVMWTDSIMRWMPKSRHPIPSEVPDSSIGTPRHDYHYLKAAK